MLNSSWPSRCQFQGVDLPGRSAKAELILTTRCVQYPWTLTSRDFWSSRNNRKPLSKQTCVLRKCCEVSQIRCIARAFKPLPLCSAPLTHLLEEVYWSSRDTWKPLSQQKCVLRKCCGVSQKWWMLQLSNLCHCVQHPGTLTSRDFWSSRDMIGSHFLSKNLFWENAVEYLRNSEC